MIDCAKNSLGKQLVFEAKQKNRHAMPVLNIRFNVIDRPSSFFLFIDVSELLQVQRNQI